MKRHISILAAVLILATLGATAQNQIDKQGRRQGHWIRTDKDGSKIFEGNFVDGLETGLFVYYYPNGTVRIRNNYTTPGKVCTHEAYDEQGRKLANGTYNQRNRDGKWQFFAPDGHMVKEATYRMGVNEGLHVVYMPNGDTAEVAHWENGHRHGRWWKRVGERGYITGTYVRGGLEGRLVQYDDNGKLVRQSDYKDGFKHGTTKLYEEGQLAVEESWTHGILIDRRIRLLTPSEEFVSIHDIACLAPKGKDKVMVVFKDGSTKTSNEDSEKVYDRLGGDLFAYANHKGRIMVALSSVQGASKDSEGRDILLLEPQPSFPIFLDEDGLKMVRSRQYEENSPLDKMR